eukprot:15336196-Ditylum_brightwellii.AAC.1
MHIMVHMHRASRPGWTELIRTERYREGTFPPCISNVLDKQCKSPLIHITYPLYVGARQAKQG